MNSAGKIAVLLGVALSGAALGAAGVGALVVPVEVTIPTSPQATAQDVVPGQTGVNQKGQSYGPLVDTTFVDAPDLMEVMATNGKVGYVETAAFAAQVAPAGSLDEALAHVPTDRKLPVYAADGSTVIGEFVLQAGTADEGGSE